MPTNPSFNWSGLQNVFYDLRTCYEPLSWSIENLHANYRVALSPNATLIAIASKSAPYPNLIEIYSASGVKIWSVVYNSSPVEYIFDFHFKDEDLVIILSNGKYRHYQDFVGNFNEYPIVSAATTRFDNLSESTPSSSGDADAEASSEVRKITNLENNEVEEINNILETQIFGHYLVTRFEYKIVITDLDANQNFQLDFYKHPAKNIHKTTVFASKDSEVLLVYMGYNNTIIMVKVDFSLSNFEVVDQELTDGPFTEVAVSPSGKLVALHNESKRKIFVVTNSFDQILLEYDTSSEVSSPEQVEWCGNDAIVLSFRDEVKLIGPGQRSISFFFDISEDEDEDLDFLLMRDSTRNDLAYTVPILQSAVDGLRLVCTNKVQFLSRVPEKTIEMYQIGSNSPSAILGDCVDKFSSNASKANANISLLKSDQMLNAAINDCLEVALDEFDAVWQKRALKAVSFGKIYNVEGYDADKYLKILNTIKVLNQLRSSEVGLFLTFREIDILGWSSVIKMLLRRSQHFLALKIIEALELDDLKPLVYVHWCCYKIRNESGMSDVELYKVIANKLVSSTKDRTNYISVDQICDIALEEGRTALSKMLINIEPSVSKKVKKLIDIDELELAMIKSFQSGSYDLSQLVLLQLQTNMTISEFFKLLNQNEAKLDNGFQRELEDVGVDVDVDIRTEPFHVRGEVVGHNWLQAVPDSDSKLVAKYLEHEDKLDELNLLKLKKFKRANPNSDGEEYYNEYKSLLKNCAKKSLQAATQKAFQRELNILELQNRLEKTYLANFYQEKSLLSIIERLVRMNQVKPAGKIVKEFSVSQEKFWYLVLRTYAKSGEFDRLYEFAFGSLDTTTGKSPIGFEPFIEAGFEHGAPKEHISVYINNSVKYKYDEKISMFIKNDDYASAAQEALRNKDIDILRNLQRKVPTSDTHATRVIKSCIQKLGY
ncbi:uncharacterized protein LODBEIA_P25860 [Lodderomyces beijingensis]|uniref:Probable vacuolar protein sorting-associated protein 16 homolog n=1 Tax=Lodderomyces beijingensis TaxID=1775926 RepID=A0ABP0ZLW3_9ASCO